MDLGLVSQLARRWGESMPNKVSDYPSQARVVTGVWITDAMIYYFEQESGLEITLSKDFNKITRYDIIDEVKFTLFVLRWS